VCQAISMSPPRTRLIGLPMLVNEGDLIHHSKALTIFNTFVSDSSDSERQEFLR